MRFRVRVCGLGIKVRDLAFRGKRDIGFRFDHNVLQLHLQGSGFRFQRLYLHGSGFRFQRLYLQG